MRTEKGVSGDTVPRGASGKRRLAPFVILLTALAMLWPALVNGGPFFMADTPSYVRAAASGFFKVLGIRTGWTEEYLRLYASAGAGAASGPAAPSQYAGQIPVTLSGRSIFYGAFVYLSELAGTLWIVVAVQSLLAGASIWLTVEAVGRTSGGRIGQPVQLLIGLGAAVLTPAAFFAGYLMPDIFGGFALLAAANLLFLWQWQSRAVRAFWFALLAYSMLVHSLNLLMVAAVAILSFAYGRAQGLRLSGTAFAGIGVCVVIAALGQAAFGQAVTAMTGAGPVRPPFLAMRLIADGPGFAYLERHCGTEKYVYCRVLDGRKRHSDTLLWSKDPKVSLFRGLLPDEQRLSSAQQSHFVAAVFRERPLQVLGDAARNTALQLVSFDLTGFNYSTGNRDRFRDTVPPGLFGEMTRTRAYENSMPTSAVAALSALVAALSFVLLVGFVAANGPERRSLRGFILCLLAGIFINAALCGALSGPKSRYQMRLVWVLPVAAAAGGAALLRRRRMPGAELACPAA